MKLGFLIFAALLAFLGTLPRLHCLCHNYDILYIAASATECCHTYVQQASPSVGRSDLFCFRSAYHQAAGNTVWSTNSIQPETLVGAHLKSSLPIVPLMQVPIIAHISTRAPPYLREYVLGLYLLHGVLLS